MPVRVDSGTDSDELVGDLRPRSGTSHALLSYNGVRMATVIAAWALRHRRILEVIQEPCTAGDLVWARTKNEQMRTAMETQKVAESFRRIRRES